VNTFVVAVVITVAALAWIAFAEHPTAANLRRALSDTVPLL
jgi:hypothetical protein